MNTGNLKRQLYLYGKINKQNKKKKTNSYRGIYSFLHNLFLFNSQEF